MGTPTHTVKFWVGALMLLFLMGIGCSSGDGFTPVSPGDPVGTAVGSGNHSCWGFYQFVCDSKSGTIDIIPLREAYMHLNALPFLEPPPMVNLTLESLEFNGDLIEADIGLRHPFLGLDEFSGFDVCGIVISNGAYTGYSDTNINIAGPGDFYLVNADGHARWWNPEEFPVNQGTIFSYNDGLLGAPDSYADFSSTINGYKYFTEGLDPDDPVSTIDPAQRGLFSAGQKNIRHYTLNMGTAGLIFNYAIDANWVFPDGDHPWVVPDDFAPEANRIEPYLVEVTETSNTLWHDGTDFGGQLSLDIDIYDWYNIDQDWLRVESPGAFTSVDLTTPTGGTEEYSTFHADFTTVTLDSSDDLMILITAFTEDDGFQGFITGSTTAAYKVHYAEVVGEPGTDPVAMAKTCDCLYIPPGGSIEFDGTDSYSPTGFITNWEWDFDGDGNFNDTYAGPAEKPVATFMDIGDYWVNLRVTDDASQTDTLDPGEQLHVFVNYYPTPPTATAKVVPTIGFTNFAGDFTGSGSSGTINLYEWDFEGDCIWDYQHATIGDTTHAYTEEYDYTAILRVTGDGCDTDEIPVRIIDPLPILSNGNFWAWSGDPPTWTDWTLAEGGAHGNFYHSAEDSDTYKHYVHFLRTNSSNDGGQSKLIQELNIDVTEYDHLYFNVFFRLITQTCPGDGWWAVNGGWPDFPVCYVIFYWNQNNEERFVCYGYIKDDATTQYNYEWEWDMPIFHTNHPGCAYYEYEAYVPLNVWHERKTIDLMSLGDDAPKELKEIWIWSHGWDYEVDWVLPWFSDH